MAPIMRILVVDDDRDTADSMAILLQMHGHEVAAAYNGLSALLEASNRHPDVVLLDLGMPAMDGYELAKSLRHRIPEAVLIALSGYTQDAHKTHAREAGIDHYLIKPVDPLQLHQLFVLPDDRPK
jgi:two-component system, chemotaxis family, CheB/CheR fusion protein